MQSGYRFSPPERAYSQVRQDVTQQDYERWQGIDLQVSSFTYSVPLPSPAVGEPITLVVRIVNNGSVAVPTARVDLWKNRSSPPTDPAGSDMYQTLTNLLPEPNNPVEVQFEVVYPQPGQYTLWVLVTPEGSVADSNPADNLQQITLQVKGPAPDLVVEKIDPIAQYPPAGRRFSVSVTIRNQGVLNAGPFRVDLWKDQLALPTNPATSDGGQLVNSLAHGASVTLSYDISYPTGGLYNLWVVPDSLNSVSEMDEANNARAMGLAVNRLDGDADGDGQVNVVDLMLVIGASSSRPGDATWNRACDFDDDDYVGPLDLLAVHDNYGANLLAGRWGGAAQYNVEMTTDGVRKGGFSFQQGLALTFDNAGRPRSLDLCLGEGPKVLWLSTEGLSSPGDTAAFCFHDQDAATGALTIRNVTALVNSVSYSKHRYAIELQITESSSGAVSGFASGLYNRTASVQADGTLLWTGSTSLLTDPAATAAPAPVLRATLARRHTPTILSASG